MVLRPVDSQEAMTASAHHLPASTLMKMKNAVLSIAGIGTYCTHVMIQGFAVCITNGSIAELVHLDSLFFDLTSKPPGTIEWE